MNRIVVSHWDSPAGGLILGSIGEKICLCDWEAEKRRSLIDRRICAYFKAEFAEGESDAISRAIGQLEEYFGRKRKEFDIPLALAGSEFQCSVWKTLMGIRYGEVISYAEEARRMGRPKSVRAVANANAVNAISIFIPCHRVIGSDNTLTGYGGGLQAKRYLIELESREGSLFDKL